jgi:glycosyltransferase involved in cell wall biosynthesis
MMRFSIVIPTFNAEKTLHACLQACLAQDYADVEVIIVDDGSTDASAEIARSFEGVQYILQENAGPAAARNRGADAATGDVVVFTDSDCVPRPDWIAQLAPCFEEGVAAVGGTYAMENGESLLARLVHEEIMARHAAFSDEVDFLGSFNMACRKIDFEAVGGFNTDFRGASGEDNDLSYRLHDAGGRLIFCHAAVVGHYHPERLGPYLRTQARHGFWRMKLYALHAGRSSGDQYAGLLDLLAPPASFLVLALAPSSLVAWWWCGHGALLLALNGLAWLSYALMHVPMTWRLFRRNGKAEMWYFAALAALRDVARALGLLHGLYVFHVRKKERIE